MLYVVSPATRSAPSAGSPTIRRVVDKQDRRFPPRQAAQPIDQMDSDQLKVILINPPADAWWEIPQRCWPPVNLLLIGEPLLRAGLDVRILDANALRMGPAAVAERIGREKPRLVGLPLYSEQLRSIDALCTAIKERSPGTRIVVGGSHPTVQPGETLGELAAVDFVLRGDAEQSLLDLCVALGEGSSQDRVAGLSFRDDKGVVTHNPPAKPIARLDDLPHLDRGPLAGYYEQGLYNTVLLAHRRLDALITSRGCPHQCAFCHNISPTYRAHSVEYLLEELSSMVGRGVDLVEIVDDNFTVDRDRALRFLREVAREFPGLRFRMKSRVDAVDRELLRAAKAAGVYLVAFGAESGSPAVLERMGKGIEPGQIERACRMTREEGIYCHTSWVLGFPGETRETVRETVCLIRAAKPTTAQIVILRPFPGTRVYDEGAASGDLVGRWSPTETALPWIRLPWAQDYGRLIETRKRMLKEIYLTPRQIARFLGMTITTMNTRLLRFMVQELGKLLGPGTGPGTA